MKWINDRNPNSPGMYGIYLSSDLTLYNNFGFAYFDGEGWIMHSHVGTSIIPYKSNHYWTVIDWGKDKEGLE